VAITLQSNLTSAAPQTNQLSWFGLTGFRTVNGTQRLRERWQEKDGMVQRQQQLSLGDIN